MSMSTAEKDRVINELPKFYTADAAPRKASNFHFKTRDACSTGNTGNISFITNQRDDPLPVGLLAQLVERCTSIAEVAKSIVLGDSAVGKTCLVNRYCRNLFDRDYKATIGVDFEVERFMILDQEFNIQIWDTAGQERFKCMAQSYYRGTHVIILVFDLTSIKTLRNTKQWLEEALEQNTTTCPEIFLVGSKKDLCKDDDFSQMEMNALKVAEEINAEYWSVSSKSGENVKRLFRRLAAVTFEQAILRELETHGKRIGLQQIGSGGGLRVEKRKKEDEDRRQKPKCCSGGRGL